MLRRVLQISLLDAIVVWPRKRAFLDSTNILRCGALEFSPQLAETARERWCPFSHSRHVRPDKNLSITTGSGPDSDCRYLQRLCDFFRELRRNHFEDDTEGSGFLEGKGVGPKSFPRRSATLKSRPPKSVLRLGCVADVTHDRDAAPNQHFYCGYAFHTAFKLHGMRSRPHQLSRRLKCRLRARLIGAEWKFRDYERAGCRPCHRRYGPLKSPPEHSLKHALTFPLKRKYVLLQTQVRFDGNTRTFFQNASAFFKTSITLFRRHPEAIIPTSGCLSVFTHFIPLLTL